MAAFCLSVLRAEPSTPRISQEPTEHTAQNMHGAQDSPLSVLPAPPIRTYQPSDPRSQRPLHRLCRTRPRHLEPTQNPHMVSSHPTHSHTMPVHLLQCVGTSRTRAAVRGYEHTQPLVLRMNLRHICFKRCPGEARDCLFWLVDGERGPSAVHWQLPIGLR